MARIQTPLLINTPFASENTRYKEKRGECKGEVKLARTNVKNLSISTIDHL
jgi:hypothetical protein